MRPNRIFISLIAVTDLLIIVSFQSGSTKSDAAQQTANPKFDSRTLSRATNTNPSTRSEFKLEQVRAMQRLTPESVVLADINAQNAGDWDTYWSLRNKISESPGDASKRVISRQQIDDGMRENVISAHLEDLKSVPIAVAQDLIGPARYIDSLIDPQSFYVFVDYDVRLENKYICNGANARLYVLDYADDGWKIIQVSEPPIITFVNSGFGIGSASEKELLDRQEVRERTGQFLNSHGQVIFSNAATPSQLSQATESIPPSCITVALTNDPEHGSTTIIGYKTVPFNDYIADVLPNEWFLGGAFYDYPESLKAGALSIKTYGWWRSLHPHGSNFDVYDSTADQVYRENSRSTDSAYVGALTATQTTGMSKSDGTIFQAQYWNGLVNVASGGANIHSGPGLSYSVINTASGGEQLAVVNGGIDTADGYRWWKIKKAGYPPPANGVGYAAGSLLLYQTRSGLVSIDDFQKDPSTGLSTFVGQLTQYGTKYWAYTGDNYQTILTKFYNSTSPKTDHQNIRFFTISVGSCSTGQTLSISAVTPTATQTLDWGLSVTYTISVVDNNGSPVSGSTVNVSDGLQAFSTFTSPTNASGQTTYTTTVPSGRADGTYDVAFTVGSSTVTRQVQVRHNACTASPAITKLTSTGATLNGAVNAAGCTATPTATLTTRSVSATSVQVNQSFTVSTSLMVSNATADHAGISISFPSLTNTGISGSPPSESYNSAQGTVTTTSSSSISGGSTLQYYGAGEILTCGSSTCAAQHLLVEGDWVAIGAGNTRSLNLTVTPKAAGTFKVRIRGWATSPGYENPSRDPSSGSTDQQSFPVYEITVNVSAPADLTGPALSINSHSNGQTVSTSSITLSGTASDAGRGDNGISSVTVNGLTASGGTASGTGTANWSRSLTLNQGSNTITVVARDNSANQNSTTQSITINDQPVDVTGPNLSITSHSNGQTVSTSSITLSGTASDAGRGDNGISSVTVNGLTASGGTATGTGTANWSRSLTLNQGSNTITVVARDNSANQNSTTQSITINYQPASSGAAYDSVLKAPKCGQVVNECDSGTLLNGRDSIINGAEPNQPNTIYNSCADNTVGTYHLDESIDRVRISTLDGSNLAPGKLVRIEVTVWAFSTSDDYLDLFYATDATNPKWAYLTTIVPSFGGSQVLSATFTLSAGASLQAIRANFLYQGAATPCSGGSGNYDDHDDLVFAVDSSASQPFQLALEQFGPVPNQALAMDAMLMMRDPFPVVNSGNFLNTTADKNTRVMLFLNNFQLGPGETAGSVIVNLVDSIGQSFDIPAEDVRFAPNSSFTQVTFRLPSNLAIGTCTVLVKVHGQSSNAGTFRIRS